MANMTNLPNKHQDDGRPDRPVAAEEGFIANSRRRLLGGAAGGMGVLMAVQAKTALGQMACQSPSAAISGNTSPRPGQPAPCSGGRSPGFWKVPQHFTYWNNLSPPKFSKAVSIDPCLQGMGNLLKYPEVKQYIEIQSSAASAIFPGASSDPSSAWLILAFPNDFGDGELLRKLIAAYLNSMYFGDYPLTSAQVIAIWNDLRSTGLYCPSGMSCAPGTAWTAAQVTAYIEGLYDSYSSYVENDLCKKNL